MHSMIGAKHADGRIVVLARDHGLKPMERSQEGGKSIWRLCTLTGEELQEFVDVGELEAQALLVDANRAAPAIGAKLSSPPAPAFGARPLARPERGATALALQPMLALNKD